MLRFSSAKSDDDLRTYLTDLGVEASLARDPKWTVLRDLMKRGELLAATSITFLVDEWGRIRWVHPGHRVHPDPDGTHGSAGADYQHLEKLLDAQARHEARDLRVMSFNIRNGAARDGDNRWDNRRDLLLKTIKRFDPDLLATQEGLPAQRKWLEKRLPGHFTLGRGRNKNGSGEQCTLFLRTSRFAVRGTGTFWLGTRPEEPGIKGWDAALPRIASWARLGDQPTGKTLQFVSTHFDHRGKQARVESAKLLRRRLGSTARELPLILGGDFNARENSAPYDALLADDSPFTDTFRAVTPTGGPCGTFNGFRGTDDGRRIDWILTSPHFDVRGAAVDRFGVAGRWPSDHYPVTTVLSFK